MNGRLQSIPALLAALTLATPAIAAKKPPANKPPATACRMLNQDVADSYTMVAVKRLHASPQLCAYSGGSGPAQETISLSISGPVPPQTAKAGYEAAYKEAVRTAGEARRLKGLGPGSAFGFMNSDSGRAQASVVFLSGRWTVTVLIEQPAGGTDATISSIARLVRLSAWPRWTGAKK